MENPNPKQINVHMFWAYGQLGQLEKLSLNSFIANDYKVILWSYDQIKNAHPQATLKDAREIIPENTYHPYYITKNIASFSDLFRYSIFQKHKGLYSDLDVVALKNATELPKEPFIVTQRSNHKGQLSYLLNRIRSKSSTQLILIKKKLGLNTNTLNRFSRKSNPTEFLSNWISIKYSYLIINNNIIYNPCPQNGDIIDIARVFAESFPLSFIAHGDLGPHYLTPLVKNFPKLSFQIMEPDFANPLNVFDLQLAFQNNYKINPKSFFIHFWNNQLKQLGTKWNPNAPFPKGSLLDTLAKKYL